MTKKGYELTVGEAKEIFLTETDLWRHTQDFLMNAKHTASYKHVLMKAILECLPETDDTGYLTFDQIVHHVTKIYWNLVITHRLRQLNDQKKASGVEAKLIEFQQMHQIPDEWNFDSLSDSHKQSLIREIKKIYKSYVFGSFFSSFNETIYSFNKKEEWIRLSPPYIGFFEKYKRILMNVTNYQLALFLENYNSKDAMERLLNKIEFVSARNSLEEFKQILKNHGAASCFYCNKTLHKIHVDHFIPWSYVQNDVLWNFVLACPACNSSKNNQLARDSYLQMLLERNGELRNHEFMKTYQEQKLINMYEYATINGFKEGWEPKIH